MNLSKVTMILRGYTYEQVKCVAEVLLDSKHIKNLEVTMNTPNAIEIIKKISSEFSGKLNIGAGTVMTFEDLRKAIDAGAKFVLSPYMMSKEMINFCKVNNVYSIPGALTPSEVAQCFSYGADCVKIFPANEFSYSYAKKIIEPMGDMSLMAVGGVNADNVDQILNSGYKFVGSAGGIFKKEDIINMDKDKLTSSLKNFERNIK